MLVAQKVNSVLGYIERSVISRSNEIILSLLSAPAGVLHPALGSPGQESPEAVVMSPKEAHENYQKAMGKGWESWGEEKALEDLGFYLSV